VNELIFKLVLTAYCKLLRDASFKPILWPVYKMKILDNEIVQGYSSEGDTCTQNLVLNLVWSLQLSMNNPLLILLLSNAVRVMQYKASLALYCIRWGKYQKLMIHRKLKVLTSVIFSRP
jgi:hypothetical protein